MLNEENNLDEIETYESVSTDTTTNTDFYNVCKGTYTVVSTIALIITVVFLYKYLKAVFKKR